MLKSDQAGAAVFLSNKWQSPAAHVEETVVFGGKAIDQYSPVCTWYLTQICCRFSLDFSTCLHGAIWHYAWSSAKVAHALEGWNTSKIVKQRLLDHLHFQYFFELYFFQFFVKICFRCEFIYFKFCIQWWQINLLMLRVINDQPCRLFHRKCKDLLHVKMFRIY